MFALFSRASASCQKLRWRSRVRVRAARKPDWDCLDKRELLSTLVLPASNGSLFTGTYVDPSSGQVEIWRTEYGTDLSNGGFQLDGADNDNDPGYNDSTVIADYNADIAGLEASTTPVPVSSVL
jgi:hypothetical protein